MKNRHEISRVDAQRAAAALMVIVGLAATFLAPTLSAAARLGLSARLRPSSAAAGRAAVSSTSVGKLQAIVASRPDSPSSISRVQQVVSSAPSATAAKALAPVATPEAMHTRTVLQIGAFRSAANAYRLQRRIRGHFPNVSVSAKRVGSARFFCVRLDGFAGNEALARAETDLRANGLEPLRVATR
jgi:cell division protein FtsN